MNNVREACMIKISDLLKTKKASESACREGNKKWYADWDLNPGPIG